MQPIVGFEQTAGAGLMLLFLADIFLTVLYARAGTGLLAPYWSRAIWKLLRGSTRVAGNGGRRVLPLAGPVIVVSSIGFWASGLAFGAAMVVQSELGTGATNFCRKPDGPVLPS